MRAKALVWKRRNSQEVYSETSCAVFIVRKRHDDFAALSYKDDPENESEIGEGFYCESEACAACQEEFDRIWLEMTDFGASDE